MRGLEAGPDRRSLCMVQYCTPLLRSFPCEVQYSTPVHKLYGGVW